MVIIFNSWLTGYSIPDKNNNNNKKTEKNIKAFHKVTDRPHMAVFFVHCQVQLAKKLKWGPEIQLMCLPSKSDLPESEVKERVFILFVSENSMNKPIALYFSRSSLTSNLQKMI